MLILLVSLKPKQQEKRRKRNKVDDPLAKTTTICSYFEVCFFE
jgi:hypothetical protein